MASTVFTTVVVFSPSPTGPVPSSQASVSVTGTDSFPATATSGIFGTNTGIGQTVTLTITRYIFSDAGGQNQNISTPTTPTPLPISTTATPLVNTSTTSTITISSGSFPSSTPGVHPVTSFSPTAVPTSRWVVVDDSDPSITYTGPWAIVSDTSQFDDTNSGMPFEGTLHSLANGTGSVEFTVNGSAGQILGSAVASNFNPTNSSLLSWTCLIDGNVVASNQTTPLATQNYWPICQWNNLTSTTHSVTLNATSQGTPFYFDRMSYVPTTGSTFVNESVMVPNTDSKIVYDETWFPYASSMMTRTNGATWSFTFEGTSVEWYGLVPAQLSKTPSIATYSIDNGTPVTFALSALPIDASDQTNHIHFKTPTLSLGAHALSVSFLGNTDTAPLNLESLIVYNGATVAETAPPRNSSVGPGHLTKINIEPIIGGVVGGLLVIAIIVATIWYLLRRAKQNSEDTESLDIDEPDEPSSAVRPFSLEMKHVLQPTPFVSSRDTDALIVRSVYRKSESMEPSLQRRLQLQNQAPISITDYSSSSTLNLDTTRGPLLHTDSGIRLPEEFPPSYTVH